MNKEQQKILLKKILPKLLLLFIFISVIIVFIVGRILISNYSKEPIKIEIDKDIKGTIENNNKIECEKIVNYNNDKISLPKNEDYIECRNDIRHYNSINSLELNSKIIAYYLPVMDYSTKENNEINADFISLFAMNSTENLYADNEILDLIFQNTVRNFDTHNFSDITDFIKQKSGYKLNKPIKLESYKIGKNAYSISSIFSFEKDNLTRSKVDFLNILLIGNRLYFMTFSSQLDNDFKYYESKVSNDEIVKNILILNNKQ